MNRNGVVYRRFAGFILSVSLLLVGCSDSGKSSLPDVKGLVSGKVTIGGKAVENVQVTFDPIDGGGPSMAWTDKEGNYSLEYGGGGEKGAVVGTHRVSFEHYAEDTDPSGNLLPGGLSMLPDKYTKGKSEITREVKEGEQTFPFDLDGLK